MTQPTDRIIVLINAGGAVGLALVMAWGATSCYETKRRYDFEKFRLEQKVESFVFEAERLVAELETFADQIRDDVEERLKAGEQIGI